MAMVPTNKPEQPVVLPASDEPLPCVETLSRAWVSRLKWYFHHSHRSGASALPDNIDLDLSTRGFIRRMHERLCGTVVYAITPRGEAMVAAIVDHARARRAPHHDLGRHLAQWLAAQGRATWEDCLFDIEVFGKPASARPDVFSMVPTLNMAKLSPQVHEIKVSRADFLCDINKPEKREAYFQLAPQVFYATPYGLIDKDDVPPECGWMEQSKDGASWIVRRPARKRKTFKPWSDRMWMTLVLRSHAGLKELPL